LPASGAFRGGGSFTYALGDNGTTINKLFENLTPNRPTNTILIAVEYALDTFLPRSKINFSTPACATPYFLSGLSQPVVCVNKGAVAYYDIAVSANPDISGILTKTQWTINWHNNKLYFHNKRRLSF
jgi:hypothetical protein